MGINKHNETKGGHFSIEIEGSHPLGFVRGCDLLVKDPRLTARKRDYLSWFGVGLCDYVQRTYPLAPPWFFRYFRARCGYARTPSKGDIQMPQTGLSQVFQ
jgi:hypothetical protein